MKRRGGQGLRGEPAATAAADQGRLPAASPPLSARAHLPHGLLQALLVLLFPQQPRDALLLHAVLGLPHHLQLVDALQLLAVLQLPHLLEVELVLLAVHQLRRGGLPSARLLRHGRGKPPFAGPRGGEGSRAAAEDRAPRCLATGALPAETREGSAPRLQATAPAPRRRVGCPREGPAGPPRSSETPLLRRSPPSRESEAAGRLRAPRGSARAPGASGLR